MRNRSHSLLIPLAYIAIDVVCISLAFYLTYGLRPGILPFPSTLEGFFLSPANPFRVIFLLWTLMIIFFNQANGLYQTRRELLESMEIGTIIRSVCTASLIVIVLAYILKVPEFPRSIFFISVAVISALLSAWRICKKMLVDYLVARGYNNFNTLIIGAGKVGRTLAREIKHRPELGIKIVGFLDDFKVDEPAQEGGTKVLGRIADFERIAQQEFVTKIFITVHHDSVMFMKLLETAKDFGMAVRVVPQGFEFMARDFIKYNIGIIPILEYSDVNVQNRQTGKRLFDLMVSSLLLVLGLPFFVLLAVLVKLDSPGPVFYHSKRYGRRGKIFHMYKFRSMVANADDLLSHLKEQNEADGPIFKIKKDPRVTAFGVFLRKYSLDELPQIINVVKGDMSLVGPRPLPIDQIEKEDLQQLKRLEIRPGITGLWQIRGRSDLSFVRLVKWDVWYINNWSFALDFYILVQTLPVVLKGKGAY